MKLYSAGSSSGYPFEPLFDDGVHVAHPDDLKKDGVLILWGGEDISPSIYGDTRLNMHTRASLEPSQRDTREVALASRAIELGVPIIGICRGAQLMCALTGGNVIQHVVGHVRGGHVMHTNDGRHIITSSLHHQMLYPWNVEHCMLAWAHGLSKIHLDQDDMEWEFPAKAYKDGVLMEPEVVYFPKTKCLAIQGHPEFGNYRDTFVQYSQQLVEELLVPLI